jgi:ABC-type transport system involved in multi-copper enzyme maturation permease subunit
VNLRSDWGHRWHATYLIHQRDRRAMIFGRGMYIVLSLSLLVAVFLLRNNLTFINENGLLVVSGAFNAPLFVVIILSSIYLALSSVTTIAREREHGTMEALFYGPIDSISYVLGKYLAQISTYVVMIVIYTLSFMLYAGLTNFTFSFSLSWIIVLSVLIASNFIAVGIFFSTLSSKVRTALLFFLSVVLVFLVIEVAHDFLSTIPLQTEYYNPLSFSQSVLAFLNQIVNWLSPLAYLNEGMEAVRRSSATAYLLIFSISTVYTLVFLGLSVVTLERKGVRK